jgi:ubiquitin-protein ligase
MGCFKSKVSKPSYNHQVQAQPPAAPAEEKVQAPPQVDVKVSKKSSIEKLIDKNDPLASITALLNFLQKEFETANSISVENVIKQQDAEPTAATKAVESTPLMPKIADKSKGYGYEGDTGNGEDARRRQTLFAKKVEERKRFDESVGNSLFVCIKMIKDYPEADNVAEYFVSNRVFNVVSEFYLRESPAADILERWALFEYVFMACQVCSENKKYNAALKNKYNLVSRLEELKQQVDLLSKLSGKEADKQEVKNLNFIVDVCQSVRDNCQPQAAQVDEAKAEAEPEKKYEKADGAAEEKYDDAKLKQLIDEKRQLLSEKKLEFVDLERVAFHFELEYSTDAKSQPSKVKLARLRKEITALSNSLPDGIYLRINQDRFDKMKVMITGPVDTPYENGLFIFDLYIPPNYPQVPPKMHLCTTGNGQFRFNPNLYNNGKVCLSLLGTWSGPGWDPQVSTILQLLVSVQAMILVDYPYENEPSYASMRFSEDSLAYNTGIRHATVLYALNWLLDSSSAAPAPAYFKDVIDAHFIVRREAILKCLDQWETLNKANGNKNCGYHAWHHLFPQGAWEKNRIELEKHLNTLSGLESPKEVEKVQEVPAAEVVPTNVQ